MPEPTVFLLPRKDSVPVKVDGNSQKRLLFGSVVPVVLLIAALPIAADLLAPAQRNGQMASSGSIAAGDPCDEAQNQGSCDGKARATDSALKEQERKDALRVVERWETEYRRKGGRASVSAGDIERLRRAIL
jgi:hypothetical protein